jgi:hypothetical protein
MSSATVGVGALSGAFPLVWSSVVLSGVDSLLGVFEDSSDDVQMGEGVLGLFKDGPSPLSDSGDDSHCFWGVKNGTTKSSGDFGSTGEDSALP